jgi:hypothetical protein
LLSVSFCFLAFSCFLFSVLCCPVVYYVGFRWARLTNLLPAPAQGGRHRSWPLANCQAPPSQYRIYSTGSVYHTARVDPPLTRWAAPTY